MKKLKQIVLSAIAGIFIIAIAVLSYIKIALPNVGAAPDMKVEITPERVSRGNISPIM